ncbi:macro domain-containing protein [Aliarcobacter lanthieri]|uniref:macro domain-containing protein n=1 Tax=Aliarcobacter lanthieri TaxID=1355374 RepID=UPI003AAC07FC
MNFNKVKIYDKELINKFLKTIGILSSIATLLFLFFDIPNEHKLKAFYGFIIVVIYIYLYVWYRANNIKSIKINIEGTEVNIKAGNIFEQKDFKVISFNEYFDTQVDDKIISSKSINGIFVNKYFKDCVDKLDEHIEQYDFEENKIEINENRKAGKKQKFKLGTICVYEDFILTAFSKFDENNRAILTMPEYLEFLIKFWDEINKVYAQKSVSVPIFGSGITRIKEHRNISDEELLKIMLWTFRISEMRFKYPAKLTIVIHKDKIDKINLLDVEIAKNGL